jgi:ankyrin repeat protein
LEEGADVNEKDNWGYTALMVASREGHTDIVKLLIKNGAYINTQDYDRRTALIYATEEGHTDVVKLLIDGGADVNAVFVVEGFSESPTIFGGRKYKYFIIESSTALIIASKTGHAEIVKLLIEAGADVYAQDLKGHTALWWAFQYGHTEVAKLLFEAGAGVNIGLIEASRYGSTEVVKLLIEAGADVNVTDNDGHTALWWAYQYGHTEVVELLREAGAFILKH